MISIYTIFTDVSIPYVKALFIFDEWGFFCCVKYCVDIVYYIAYSCVGLNINERVAMQTCNMYLPKKTVEKLDKIKKANGANRSASVTLAVDDYFKKVMKGEGDI